MEYKVNEFPFGIGVANCLSGTITNQVVQRTWVVRVPVAHGEVDGHDEVQLQAAADVVQEGCVLKLGLDPV